MLVDRMERVRWNSGAERESSQTCQTTACLRHPVPGSRGGSDHGDRQFGTGKPARGTQVLQRHGGGDRRDGPRGLRTYLLPAASSPCAGAAAAGTDAAHPPARPPVYRLGAAALGPGEAGGGKADRPHRQLGVAGAAMAGLMVVVGTLTALYGVVRGVAPFGIDPRRFMIVPLFSILLFVVFVVAGVRARRDAQSHKRLMLLATIAILPPAIARWVLLLGLGPPVVFAVATLFLVPLIGWDLKTRRRLHPVTLWGGLLLVVSGPLRLTLAQTDGWLVISDWLVGLVK